MGCTRYTEVIPAGTVDKVFAWGGDFLFIEDLTRSFEFKLIEPTGGDSGLYAARSRMEIRQPFRSVRVKNSSDVDVTFTVYVGTGEVRFLDVVLPPTRLTGSNGSLGLAGNVDIAGVDANGFRRKQIVIGNQSTSENLYVYIGGTGTEIGFVPPLTSWTVETDATLRLVYAGSGTLLYNVAELYYK